MALWGGRFQQTADDDFAQFNASLAIDYQLAQQDIAGSLAWAGALYQAKVLTESEWQQLRQGLQQLAQQVTDDPQVMLQSGQEDIHSWVEAQLVAQLGEVAKKLHTGRSRNDQVATDLRLWCKQQIGQLTEQLKQLQVALVALAEQYQTVIMPGYTHLQRAQPIPFAHWCLAYVEMLARDLTRLEDCHQRLDVCPLGAGALAGTAYPIDRPALASALGFASASNNSLDAVSDRDYVVELLFVASMSMLHLSRFAEDMIFFNSGEAAFIVLSDRVTSGSSLMPQKKNPDALELIRGKCGRVQGALSAMMITLKGLPLAYNKDLQEDKALLFEALTTWRACLAMATRVLDDLQLDAQRCQQAAEQGYANATVLADYLVQKGIPFRQAHQTIGAIVLYAQQKARALEQLTLTELQQFCPLIAADVYPQLALDYGIEQRDVLGGVANMQVQQQIDRLKQKL